MITKKNIIDVMGMFTDTAVVKVIDNDGNIMDITDISYCQNKTAEGEDKFAIALRIDKSYAEPKPPQDALQNNDENSVSIWTDGACSGNPGTGGWAYYIKFNTDGELALAITNSGRVHIETTNNRMELIAAIKALESYLEVKDIINKYMPITITTDSEYMVNIMTNKNKVRANFDLVGALHEVCKDMNVTWVWQRRNSCDELKRCDSLANTAATTPNYKHKK